MFESSPDCVKLLDLDGRLLRMNRNGLCLMELESFGSLEGAPWSALWPAESRNTVAAAVAAARRGEVSRFRAPCATAQGTEKWWDVTVSAVRQGGAISHLLSVSRDVTELVKAIDASEQAREVAEQATRAKSVFVANLSHEIRTPLNAIVGLAQLLGASDLRPADQAQLAKIRQAGQHLLALIDDVLDLSKVETGRLTLNERDFDLKDVLDRVTGMLGDKARERGIALEVTVAPKVPTRVFGDPARLCQVLLNYTANALRFTDAGRIAIDIRLAARDDDSVLLHFDVIDSGRGLSEAEIERLFADFSQARQPVQGGSGLGLAICKRLARLMGGDVGVESEPGLGSRFWFTARLRERATDGTALAEFAEPPAVLAGKRILLVDDDDLNREVVQQLLEMAGSRVHTATNGREALDTLARGSYDAVLMDLFMPVMGGLEAMRLLRQHAAWQHLPVIAMSANVRPSDRAACAEAGASDFVAKPMDVGKLWSVLAHWTSRPVGGAAPAGHGDEFFAATIPGLLKP
nr:response regulator [Ramlibacter aurantiacus]